MAIKFRSLEGYEGDPLIPILNLVYAPIPLLLYDAVSLSFMTIEVNSQKTTNVPNQQTEQNEKLNLMAMIDGDWDYRKLNRKPKEITENPREETQIILGAIEDSIKYEVLI
jgi:hypothetical protein